jgi:REP element-mobilizing transposase RayT
MARPIRIEYPGAFYHVTCRGNERKPIFRDDADRHAFLDILAASLETFKVSLHGYVFMDNHFHLIIETPEANLGKLMQRFNTAYTVYYNRRHNRNGHLYQGRYKAILIDADEYLLELSRYVHLNPVRIRKYSRFPIDEKKTILESYRWSSYGGYVHQRQRQPFVTYDMILAMVGDCDIPTSRQQYKRFILSGITDDLSGTYWDDIKWQMLKGTEDFADRIYSTFIDRKAQSLPSGMPLSSRRTLTIDDIAGHVSAVCDVDRDELYCKRSASAIARSLFMELSCAYLNARLSMTQIARELGNVSVAALSHNKRRLHTRMEKDETIRWMYEEIKKKLEQS